jgi:hypothetical protein
VSTSPSDASSPHQAFGVGCSFELIGVFLTLWTPLGSEPCLAPLWVGLWPYFGNLDNPGLMDCVPCIMMSWHVALCAHSTWNDSELQQLRGGPTHTALN